MPFFDSSAEYRPQGKALFSYTESPVARQYAHRISFLSLAGIIGFTVAIFLCTMTALILETADWSRIGQVVDMRSGDGWFFALWLVIMFISILLYRPSAKEHVFFANVARIYRGTNKRPYFWILPRKVDRMTIKAVHFKNEYFYVVTVGYRWLTPKFLGRPSDLKFGISTQSEPKDLIRWAQERKIVVDVESF